MELWNVKMLGIQSNVTTAKFASNLIANICLLLAM